MIKKFIMTCILAVTCYQEMAIDIPQTAEERIAFLEQKENDIELLARLINAECGADWCEDEMLYLTGSVVLNRVASEEFPNTMEEVIFQTGQYAVVNSGAIYNEPSERCYEIAVDLVENGPIAPCDVVFQANFKQGSGVYSQVQNMYFCYR